MSGYMERATQPRSLSQSSGALRGWIAYRVPTGRSMVHWEGMGALRKSEIISSSKRATSMVGAMLFLKKSVTWSFLRNAPLQNWRLSKLVKWLP
jgi:hypothetical protein